jgi:membrane protease subunit HflK
MQQIYSNVTKVVVDSKQGSNLLYLPLDKVLQMTASPAAAEPPAAGGAFIPQTPSNTSGNASALGGNTSDPRSRDTSRTRDRDAR